MITRVSASKLETYVSCPYRYYIKYVQDMGRRGAIEDIFASDHSSLSPRGNGIIQVWAFVALGCEHRACSPFSLARFAFGVGAGNRQDGAVKNT